MTVTSNFKLSKATEKRVSELTLKLKTHWKKSTEAVLEVGKCLHELKQLLPRKDFIAHVKKEIGISEKHAMRLIEVHLRFGKHQSKFVLGVQPTVLYQLAYSCSDRQVQALVDGKKIKVGGVYKTATQICTKDFVPPKRKVKIEIDREMATFFEEFQDGLNSFSRALKKRTSLKESVALKETINETIKCLKNFNLLIY